jgi:sugar lactone lactonase YvrE
MKTIKSLFLLEFSLIILIFMSCNNNATIMQSEAPEVITVLDTIAGVGEGAIWDYKYQRLLWIDIPNMRLHIYTPSNKQNRTIQLNQTIGTVVPYKEDVVVVALEKGIFELNLETEELIHKCDLELGDNNNRLNDGKCDANGRLWVGSMDKNVKPHQASFYVVDTDYVAKEVFDSVSISNGVAWSLDNKTMYYQDSPTKEVVAFDFNLQTGTLSNKRTAIKIPDLLGDPDGNTIDEEGMLWMANWGTACITRWNPNTGELLSTINIPAINVTALAFGGNDLDELYVTTAQYYMPEGKDSLYIDAGKLFMVKPGVKGVKANYFGK